MKIAFTIFGVAGHLSRTKLLPALYELFERGLLPEGVAIVGAARRPWDDGAFRDFVRAQLKEARLFEPFSRRLFFVPLELTSREDYRHLAEKLTALAPNHIYYLAVPPHLYFQAIEGLGEVGLHREEGGFRRLVLEKPFGKDLESARALEAHLARFFKESQLFRIDHYLGKAAVQNLFIFRFANLLFEPIWNRGQIEQVQITHSERAGLEGRAGYYEGVGALRDMIQSHLLQLLTLVAFEPPARFDAEALREEKIKVLRSVRRIAPGEVDRFAFRAQYEGYLQEEGVSPSSRTETFAALKLFIDNWRWQGVPFYLRTGKRLKEDRLLVAIRFRQAPPLFGGPLEPNWLLFKLQPEECARLEVYVRDEGREMRPRRIRFDAETCGLRGSRFEAYEMLLLDLVEGDQSLFLERREVLLAWEIVEPILKAWEGQEAPLPCYPPGGSGPEGAASILEPGHRWRELF